VATPAPDAVCPIRRGVEVPEVSELLPPEWASVLEPVEVLSQGAYSRVYKAKVHKQSGLPGLWSRHVALKVFIASFGTDNAAELENMRHFIEHELDAISKFNGPPYATVYKAQSVTYRFMGTERPGLLVAMELGDMTLRDVATTPVSGKKARRKRFHDRLAIFTKMLRGLSQMHEQGYHHRDVKPENVILVCQDKKVLKTCETKLIDLGYACYFKAGSSCAQWDCGTAEYKNPEGEADDVWAAAMVMRELLVGSLPEHIADRKPDLYSILHDYRLVPFREENPEWYNLMEAMFAKMPQDRISMPDASLRADELFEKTFGAERPSRARSLPGEYLKAVEGIKSLDPDYMKYVAKSEASAAAA